MFLSNPLSETIGLTDAAVIALLGYAVVFFGLILLMIVVILMGRFFISKNKKSAKAPAPAAASVAAATPVAAPTPVVSAPADVAAPGTAGNLKLHDVNPKTAAMIMAIVANQMQKPLNELRFISIKEVEK